MNFSFDRLNTSGVRQFVDAQRSIIAVQKHMNDSMKKPLQILAWPAYRNEASNPYTYLLYSNMGDEVEIVEFSPLRALFGRYSILHVHWPEAMFTDRSLWKSILRSAFSFVLILLLKIRAIPITWTVHNAKGHEVFHHQVSDRMWSVFTKHVSALIFLTQSSATELYQRYPSLQDVPSWHIPHGHYRMSYPNSSTIEEARQRLGLHPEDVVIGHVGAIRPYKNLVALIQEFRKIEDPQCKLLIAGKPSTVELAETISREAEKDKRIHLRLEFIQNDDLQIYFGASDLMIFPYSSVLNSGSVLLSLSFNRSVLVPNFPTMIEMAETYGDRRVHLYGPPLTADAMLNAVRGAMPISVQQAEVVELPEWEDIAAKTIDVYKAIT